MVNTSELKKEKEKKTLPQKIIQFLPVWHISNLHRFHPKKRVLKSKKHQKEISATKKTYLFGEKICLGYMYQFFGYVVGPIKRLLVVLNLAGVLDGAIAFGGGADGL